MSGISIPEYREVNGHIHTPFSFSAFDRLETAFKMAKEEEVAVLGINDFFVTDGYDDFKMGCLRNDIFPLFNIEFIGLLKKEQKNGVSGSTIPTTPEGYISAAKGSIIPLTRVSVRN